MSIRKAVLFDASSLAALSIEVWVGTYLRKGVGAFFADYALTEFTKANFERLIPAADETFLVSDNDEGIDGFIRISRDRAAPVDGCSTTEICTFYVQPRHQGKGVGGRLLNAALDHCAGQGAQSVWLTTNSENAPAIAYYLARGFIRRGVTHFRIGEEAYPNDVFSLDLDAR